MSLLDGSPRSASVEAVAASSGFWMSREAFSALRVDCPSAAMKVLWQLSQTLETRRRGALSRLRLQLAQVESEASLGHEARELLLPLRWV
jgi:CRP-like cAMP-binding protein